jgi:7-cyano-7-deazaguanine reductase
MPVSQDDFSDTQLGKASAAVSQYTPSLLFPIARSRLRENLPFPPGELPFEGVDLWTAWELTWLDRDGKPEVGVLQVHVPCDSRAIVESKSLKLYLGSFAQTPFASAYDVVRTLESDISVTVGAPVVVDLLSLAQATQAGIAGLTGDSLDGIRIASPVYHPDPSLLERIETGRMVTETVHTHLFRSLCPVTGQPDMASVQISYTGPRIEHEDLLRYLVSYREHQGFHEHCVERIFLDLMEHCRPRELTVYARFLRRGGIDINPFRSTAKGSPVTTRLVRQ